MKLQKQGETTTGIFTLPEAYIAGRSTNLRAVIDVARQKHIRSYPQDLQIIRKVAQDVQYIRDDMRQRNDPLELIDEDWERIRRNLLLEAHENKHRAQIGNFAHVIGPVALSDVDLSSLRDIAKAQRVNIEGALETRSESEGRFGVINDPEAAILLVEAVAVNSIIGTIAAFGGPELP
jgi:hypothetical protein